MSTPVTSKPLSAPPEPGEVYRPVSGLAIAGLVLGVLSCLVFVLDAPWFLLFFSLPALVISLFARRRIGRSEGTLAGSAVASAGIIFALISTLGYSVAYFTTYFIVFNESKRFLNEWVRFLDKGEEGSAFLLTQSTDNRRLPFNRDDVERLRVHFPNPMSGVTQFDSFRNEQVPSLALRYAKQGVEWKSLGWPQWKYAQGDYTLTYRYQISTPLLISDVEIAVKSEKGNKPNVPKRRWKIESSKLVSPSFLPYGEDFQQAYRQAEKGIETWIGAVTYRPTGVPTDQQTDRRGEAFAFMLTREERNELAVAGLPAATIGAVPGLLMPPPLPAHPLRVIESKAAKLADFEKLYSGLRSDRHPRRPNIFLLNDDRHEKIWTLDVRLFLEGSRWNVEVPLTLKGDYQQDPPVWYIYSYKIPVVKKRPPSPFDMP